MVDVTNQEMRELLDKQAIHEALMRYCRGIDRCDEELIRSAYHPGAYDDHGEFRGTVEEFVPWALHALQIDPAMVTMHSISNEYVEVRGDVAFSEAYFIAYHRSGPPEKKTDMTLGGRYVDRYERRNGQWKIARRRVLHDWTRVDYVDRVHERIHLYQSGVRTREDESFRRDW
jgi:SnoaL-like domain